MIKDIILPSLGEGITEGTVISLLVDKGDLVEKHQSIIEVETDKVTIEVPIEDQGTIEEVLVKEGDTIEVDQIIAKISVSSDLKDKVAIKDDTVVEMSSKSVSAEEKEPPQGLSGHDSSPSNPSLKKPENNHLFRASPLARKLARELGVHIDTIRYDGGRVRVADVKNLVKARLLNTGGPKYIQKPLPDFNRWGIVERKKLSPMGNAILKNMEYSWATIPHAWINEMADITNIEASRQKHKAQVKLAKGCLTITSLLVKVCVLALKKHPIFNSSFDTFTSEIVHKNYYNIGVAVDTGKGLLVPVIKNADEKSLSKISQDLRNLSQAAKLKKTTMEDLEGATFTISNLGGIGGTGIMPIINPPEVGILGVGTSSLEPKWNGIEFEPRLMMPITVAFDHRIINGTDALRFLRAIKEILEDPFSMILET